MFIARENELNELEGRYSSDHFEFAMIYGRRRIGKTRLIEEFVKCIHRATSDMLTNDERRRQTIQFG